MEKSEGISRILSDNVIELRKMRGLTQSRLAQVSGIPRSTITYLESGTGNPSLWNMTKIANALEIKIEELFVKRSLTAQIIKSKDLSYKDKNGSQVFNLLPTPIKGLVIEKFELAPLNGFIGIPHLKGTTEYFICIQGRVKVSVSGEDFIVNKGDILIFLGNEKHSYENLTNAKAMAISVVTRNKN